METGEKPPYTRACLIEAGNTLRRRDGPGALAVATLSRLDEIRASPSSSLPSCSTISDAIVCESPRKLPEWMIGRGCVAIDSIRHPAEVEALRKGPCPFLLLVGRSSSVSNRQSSSIHLPRSSIHLPRSSIHLPRSSSDRRSSSVLMFFLSSTSSSFVDDHPVFSSRLFTTSSLFLLLLCVQHVTAPAKLRYAWLLSRNRAGDVKTEEEFVAAEELELRHPDKDGQQLLDVFAEADLQLENTAASREAFFEYLDVFFRSAVQSRVQQQPDPCS